VLFSSPPWDAVTYWSLDLETGGLDARKDPILAVGMVPIRGGRIRLGESFRTLVRPGRGRIDPASVRAHQLVEREVRDAPALEEVLPIVERQLRGNVLLVHHKAIDVAFLKEASRRTGARWPGPKVVDTVDLLLKVARRARFTAPEAERDLPPPLNLSAAREAHGLPPYAAHDALTDAVATAELFLVLRHALGARTLRDLR
jgi:DNA polymerase-3 subunit epsilon